MTSRPDPETDPVAAPASREAVAGISPAPGSVIVTIGLVAFVTALDNTVLTVALRAMDDDLHLGQVGLEWVGASYLLTFAALLLVGGRLADRWGHARTLLAGTAAFSGASVLGALAPSGPLLVAGRALMGVGAALVLPAALAVVAGLSPAARRTAAGVWTAAIAAALSAGPVVGGVLTETFGWRSVFWVHVPIGVLTIGVARRALRGHDDARASRADGPLDLPGLAASAVGLFGVTAALLEWHAGSGAGRVGVATGLAAVGWGAFVVVERAAPRPLVPGTLLRHRVFVGGTVSQILWGLGMNGVVFFTALYLQRVLGLSPSRAGTAFVPVAVAVVVAVPVANLALARVGAATTVALGLVVVAGGLVAVSLADPAAGLVGVVPGLLAVGFGSGLTTPLTDAVLHVVPPGEAGVASAVVSAAREMSGVLGIAIVGLVLARAEAASGLGGDEAFGAGFRTALLVASAVVAVGAAVAGYSLASPGPRARRHLW